VSIEPTADSVAVPFETLLAVAHELAAAERERVPIQPISARMAGFDLDAAYRVQSINIENRIADGAVLVGHKVGLTNPAMQVQLGVRDPDFGHVLDDMRVAAGTEVSLSEFIAPRIEPEIAFILGRDLIGPRIMSADVLFATEAVAPALEIIDSRIADWKIKLVDTVADNASSSRVVVGEPRALNGMGLIDLHGRMERDGEVIGSGRGADVLGDPAAAVAWLVNTLSEYGQHLKAGEVVIPGALCASAPLVARSEFRADIDNLGSVSVRVVR
jgi:2-keto-4-pentenoate hydratase